ncbi:MAG: hypothetical protein QXS81_03020 [Candidatus Micrarchaeaceae archaeon]
MAKDELTAITEDAIKNGGLLLRLYFDMQDKDKNKLQPLLVDLLNNRLLKEKDVIYGYGKIREPIENEGFFVTSAIITVLLKGIRSAINIMFNYAPIAVEVLKPEKEAYISSAELQAMLLDISNISITYSKYILDKVLSKEDKIMIAKQLENRAEIGKKLIGNSEHSNPEI